MTATEFLEQYGLKTDAESHGLSETIDFKELDDLVHNLIVKGIPRLVEQIFDGFVCKVYGQRKVVCTVILHRYSYGHEKNLLEFWTGHREDDPKGWLTGAEALGLVLKEL